jgi:predicted transcriptional regulator
MSDKQAVLDAVRRLPESSTIEQISEEIAILAAIRRGEDAADTGQVLTHDEAKRRSAGWVTK